MVDIIVKNSKIEGKGVFAGREFKKGEVVIKWDISKQLKPKEIQKIPENEKKYIAKLKGKYIFMLPPARYVNHSCDSNTYAKNFCDIAKRKIKKGEEITSDYSATMDKGESMLCKCGDKNCKKVIKKNI